MHPRIDRAEALSNLAGKKLRAQHFRVGNEKKEVRKVSNKSLSFFFLNKYFSSFFHSFLHQKIASLGQDQGRSKRSFYGSKWSKVYILGQ